MIRITIEATEEDRELLPLMLDHLCYSITIDSCIQLYCPDWKGHSGGDDAYFGLTDKIVEVKVRT